MAGIRDVGAFIGGVIAGLVVIVAVIVAFKGIVILLVALGVKLIVAKIITAVIGLGLLAYGLFQAYQARVAAGEEGGLATFGKAVLDMTGITDVYRAVAEPGLTPFERGFSLGKGIASIGSFFLTRGIGNHIKVRFEKRFPRLANPERGSARRWLRNRFGGKQETPAAQNGVQTPQLSPAPGEAIGAGRQLPPPQAEPPLAEVIPIGQARGSAGPPTRLQPGRQREVSSLDAFRQSRQATSQPPSRAPEAAVQQVPQTRPTGGGSWWCRTATAGCGCGVS